MPMDLFVNAIKGQFNSLNFIVLVLTASFLCRYYSKQKISTWLVIFAIFFFVLTSTDYLPRYLIRKMESGYHPFSSPEFNRRKDTIYIQSLGGGYTSDQRLSPSAQLSPASLGRLIEAIRIARIFENGILVLSGHIASGKESLASLEKQAAIQLGFDANRIITLETPSNTQEEAIAFANRFGNSANLILVTDAIHMPRAMKFFREQGITPFPAPTNYLIKKDETQFSLGWIPSAENLQLMDRVWREYLGSIKGVFMNSKSKTIEP